MLAQQAPDISDPDRQMVIDLLTNIPMNHQQHIHHTLQICDIATAPKCYPGTYVLVELTTLNDPLKVKIANKLLQNPIIN